MSEIITKAQQADFILANDAVELSERVPKSLAALSGLCLSDLSTSAMEVIEPELVAINHIQDAYAIVTNDDYQAIEDADLREMRQRIHVVTETAIESEAKRVMMGLGRATQVLPETEIAEVRRHPDIFVPLLMDAMKEAIAAVRENGDPPDEAHFFAAFLLTELEVDEAFPLLMSGFRLNGVGSFDLFGDAVHELLPRTLALFAPDDLEPMEEMLRDARVDIYVRWAALNAYKLMIRDATITKRFAVEKLREHLKWFIENEVDDLIAAVICELSDLAAEDTLETIRAAFDLGIVDTEIIDREFVEMQIGKGEDTLQETLAHCPPTGMPDTIEELRRWAVFSELDEGSVRPQPIPPPSPLASVVARDDRPAQAIGTVRLDETKVGRNDPCPCGSGKKFKKCCR